MSLEDKIKARAASAGIDPAKVSVAVVGAPETLGDVLAELRASHDLTAAMGRPMSVGTLRRYIDRLEAAHKREAGDAAKLRGVLETLRELLGDLLRLGDAEYHDDFSNFCDIIDAALAEPPRNCDVGTADDWLARFNVVCERCYGSDCDHRLFKNEEVCDCFARWLQMPYESEVSDGNE